MIQIRPVSDLRNKYPEIENIVKEGKPVYLTKNGHGAMVVMGLDQYAALTENMENKLDEADYMAQNTQKRLSHEEVFGKVRNSIGG